ncbi:peptide chain release factor N(5)-glutamine methyltransferase [Spongiivirga citrea]|uniref:peptide chain release factor N(5)-glutamine methyltransferase n=1 Tax=Spongiivirga citrea TaxID=1481457 RepID=A0A6M0CI34_9FLAO|nr:peptide chain release factor N(5)-glutamine methyltransferase [Spongiivirga citrea]NER17626.1 peptide chain release factor N(5)-glutamine methyltransferase [Spongiivirga citrea]
MKLTELKNIFHKELDAQYGSEEVSSFFFMLTEHHFGISRLSLALDNSLQISKEEETTLYLALSRLNNHEPIQYIIGQTHFFGLDFQVNQHTLIPRPETEDLVQWIIDDHQSLEQEISILDIGTGSGCIAISLAKNIQKAAVSAIDIDELTIDQAAENAQRNNVQVSFIKTDILGLDALVESYDIIVSNPPYVREQEKELMQKNVLQFEPDKALFVSDDDPLIFYKKIAELAFNSLSTNGKLYFEINEYLSEETKEVCEAAGFIKVTVKNDIFGKPRMIKAIRV